MPPVIRRLLSWMLGEYSVYHVLSSAHAPARQCATAPDDVRLEIVEPEDLAAAEEPLIREQAWYGGPESRIYACRIGARVVACCIYWYGARYRTRNFWPLTDNQAKLVQIVTLPGQRGRGLARALIAFSTGDMRRLGFETLFARVWHSNRQSLSAFERAGWRRIATVVEFRPLSLGRNWRLVFGAKPSGAVA
jgi:ribosomal protein S18 acetylase RimI-like enzyme